MGGIVSNLWKKDKNKNEQQEKEQEKEEEEKKKKNESIKEIGDEKKEDDIISVKQENNLMKNNLPLLEEKVSLLNEEIKLPNKPPDLIFLLDLYCDKTIIQNQIRTQLITTTTTNEYSPEFQNIYLENSNNNNNNSNNRENSKNNKPIKFPKFIYNPSIHLKQLKHQWMKPFTTYIQNQQSSFLYVDAHFRQISTLKVSLFLILSTFPATLSVC